MADLTKTMVVLDMDGTLLTSDKTISPKTLKFLRKMMSQGLKICLASGRPYRAIKPYIEELGLSTYVVCFNGGVIIDPTKNDKVIYKAAFPSALIEEISKTLGEKIIHNFSVEDLDKIFLQKDDETSEYICFRFNSDVITGEYEKKLFKYPLGCLFYLSDMIYADDLIKLLSESNYPGICIRFWDNTNVAEMFFKDVNKYTSLKQVANTYGISNENIICFGDGDNDIEMVKKAGIGVAMRNSTSHFLKASADMISLEDNDHDGVGKTLALLLNQPWEN